MAIQPLAAVEDQAELRRCIFYRAPTKLYSVENGKLRLGSQAFADSSKKPSVDLATLRAAPEDTCKSPEDGVVTLTAADVRAIRCRGKESASAKSEVEYIHDVHHDPVPDNPAHAEIRPNIEYKTGSVFKRVLESLARRAEIRGWTFPPLDCRGNQQTLTS